MNAQATHTALIGITDMLEIVRNNGYTLGPTDLRNLGEAIESIRTVTNSTADDDPPAVTWAGKDKSRASTGQPEAIAAAPEDEGGAK